MDRTMFAKATAQPNTWQRIAKMVGTEPDHQG